MGCSMNDADLRPVHTMRISDGGKKMHAEQSFNLIVGTQFPKADHDSSWENI